MITEDYVSFEIAKLLKEKGFDEPTLWFYAGDRTRCLTHKPLIGNWYKRPTLQMAMKWLREVHHLFIELDWYPTDCKAYIYDTEARILERRIFDNSHGYSYEEACEAAIKYCLENLI